MDNQRLILFLIFSFSLIMLWEAWQKQGVPQAQPPSKTAVTAPSAAPGAADVPASATAPVPSAIPAAGAASADASAKVVAKTDLYVAEISALGGDLTRLELLRHLSAEDRQRNLVEQLVQD